MRLRPPDLIIQDELHLISDALGSMVGLYETAIDRLCSRQPWPAIRPVLVASTATVRRARDQVEQVFARGLTVFPPPVLDAGETFFSATVRAVAVNARAAVPGHPRARRAAEVGGDPGRVGADGARAVPASTGTAPRPTRT